MFTGSLNPYRGRAAFSNCHQNANKSTSSVSQTQIHIFLGGEGDVCEARGQSYRY